MSTLQKTILKAKLPPIVPVGSLGSRGNRRGGIGRKRDYTPVKWSRYFSQCRDVAVNGNQFRVYCLGDSGPLLVLLHGGGFSALTWALFSSSVTSMVGCQVLAIDLRGHGDTVTTNEEDLSAETMARDVGDVVTTLYETDPPPVILIGHSMGGAIAVHAASANYIPSLIGLAVIDVVEGTALDALASMQSFLRGRPTNFKSLEHAIEWCIRSGQVRNIESAKVSMPGQIKNSKSGKLATNDIDTYVPVDQVGERHSSLSGDAIEEEETEASNSEGQTGVTDVFKHPSALANNNSESSEYVWRIDLGQTEKYWSGWFKGLSNTFLNCPVPKMLLLAGIDRLDKDLTVGQMQGKFQMQVLPQCGHAVHEDVPDKVAEVLATFMVRHKFAEPESSFERTFPAC
ncbi:protein phosphatase methylesterase 1 [Zootermopsis nevadensis]|uniref:Protein phosphatase methylesterase 1 n=1 Tax=Zootermopsis nevadensis TaxID=136037 RepID=A0A067R9Z5_ZOONE|nr:protein phosphatase methylesterase 1 [Zootermopsis nevadensis]KDR16494.1 Protein phosphatase methylesterase 1 [Zootermopsis nevadensis]